MLKQTVLIILIFLTIFSCSKNLLVEFGSSGSDESLLFQAKTALNNQFYQDAIDIISLRMSPSAQITTEVRTVLASAYAGKCGLNFVDYTQGLAGATAGSLFHLASTPFVGRSVDANSCLQSLQTIDLIGLPASRTTDQNTFAAIVGMVLMGSANREYTDNTPVNGDGAQDSLNISCTLTDPQVNLIAVGYAYLSQNATYLTGALVGGTSLTTINDAMTLCNTLAGSMCNNTNPATITSGVRDTIKDLMNTVEYGIGAASGSNPLLIPAACP